MPLVIDPVLVYSTYLGGRGDEYGFGIAVDSSGNAYVTGSARVPTDFPTVNPFQASNNGIGNGAKESFVAQIGILANSSITPGDYDGDGKSDVAVWRPSTGVWYVKLSGSQGSYTATNWGVDTDIPVPGDYDADGKTDIAVWRPGNGTWYISSGRFSTFNVPTFNVPAKAGGGGGNRTRVRRPSANRDYMRIQSVRVSRAQRSDWQERALASP